MASWSREAGAAVLVKADRPHRPLANGVNGMNDIEGKVAREAMSECGQRASFKSFGVARVSAEEHMLGIPNRVAGFPRLIRKRAHSLPP
jgi:hypothetical protein